MLTASSTKIKPIKMINLTKKEAKEKGEAPKKMVT